jgi:hypothetical protein
MTITSQLQAQLSDRSLSSLKGSLKLKCHHGVLMFSRPTTDFTKQTVLTFQLGLFFYCRSYLEQCLFGVN